MSGPLTIKALTAAYRGGETSPLEELERALENAGRAQSKLNCFQNLAPELARRQAEDSALRWTRGEARSPLDGVPISIKDTIPVAGLPCRSGSRTTSPEPCTVDSSVSSRLKEAGTVLLGKTTTSEFAWKPVTQNPLSGLTGNPWDISKNAGGSSGGAAASVAGGACPAAIGTDAGGSTRLPASFCGVVGFKPSFGRVPHWPARGLFSTLSSTGIMTLTVADAALVLDQVAKPDSRDPSALPDSTLSFSTAASKSPNLERVAFIQTVAEADPDDGIVSLCADAVSVLRSSITEVTVLDRFLEPLRARFHDYWAAGMAEKVRSVAPEHRGELDPGLQAAAAAGESVTTERLLAAHTNRMELAMDVEAIFDRYQLILTPTCPTSPFAIDVDYTSIDRWRHATPYTYPFNLSGHPAITIPCGLDRHGLPVGLQIVGPRYRDDLVLSAAAWLESLIAFDNRLDQAD